MSRGLGRLQRAVLDHLQERGKWDSSWSIVDAIFHNFHPEAREYDRAPDAFDVSVRRAINGLLASGLVCTAEYQVFDSCRSRADRYARLAVWLADHEPPPVKPSISGAEVEATVLQWITQTTRADIEEYVQCRGPRWIHEHHEQYPDDIPYSFLTREMMQLLNNGRSFREGKEFVAVSRAVQRLEAKGLIRTDRYRRRCYFVRMVKSG
jgi:hypothetical protein